MGLFFFNFVEKTLRLEGTLHNAVATRRVSLSDFLRIIAEAARRSDLVQSFSQFQIPFATSSFNNCNFDRILAAGREFEIEFRRR